MYISLLNNITLLVSLSLVHSLLLRYMKQETVKYRIISGLLFGLVAVIGMINTVEVAPGIIFDGRSIILVTAGVFGGPVSAVIAIVISLLYRIGIGGQGTLMGVLVIIESGLFGILFYYLRKKYKWASGTVAYYGLGFVVHAVIIFLTFSLPAAARQTVLPQIILPVIIIYPVATLLLFLLFQNQESYLRLFNNVFRNEQELKEANELAGLGSWELIHGSNRLEWSDTIFDIFEIDNSRCPSYEEFLDLIHPDDREHVNKVYKESLRNRTPYEVEHRLLMKDGRIKWVFEKCHTEYDGSGKPAKSTGIVQDITGIKITEIALEESRLMLRKIIDTIPVRVFWKDLKSRYMGCNLAFARDAGFDDPDKLVGLDDYQMGWIDQADLYRKDDAEVMRTGIPKIGYEEPQTTPDGETLWLQTSKLPLTYTNNDIIGMLGIYENITERKKMEDELIVARDRARESDRLKTAFLNNLSHEIRTPLNAIVGFSEIINKPGINSEELQYYTDIILQSSSQLLAIIDDIFDIAAIEAGQVRVVMKETNVYQLLLLVYKHYIREVSGKDIELVCNYDLPESDLVIITDETKLTQILMNLTGNALKFTRSGKIEFGCTRRNGELLFFVKDTGIGIPAEMHEIIFERFRKVNLDSTGEFSGSGLGLFIVRSYVELLGGRIWLESSPGSGSRFFFTIPCKPADKKSEMENSMQADESVFLKNERKTILVAEDNYMNFLLIKEYLSEYPMEIIHAINGLEAVEQCRKRADIDMVLMDIKMPVMDGFEATGKIRTFMPGLPVIALTAYAQSGDREKVKKHGCTDYLSKPFERKKLLVLLNKYLYNQ